MTTNFNEYLNLLSKASYSPGGGSACCNILKISASLFLKSINITMARKSFNNLEESIKKDFLFVADLLNENISYLSEAEEEDIKLFNDYMVFSKAKDEEKLSNVIHELVIGNCGYKLIKETINFVDRVLELKDYIVSSIMSDYTLGLRLIEPCLLTVLENMKENTKNVNDSSKEEYEDIIYEIEDEISILSEDIYGVIK